MGQIGYALFITGNPGSGKSYIANKLGANFQSGFSTHGRGVTNEVYDNKIQILDEFVLIIDAPGLFEPDLPTTQRNAKLIVKAVEHRKDIPRKIGIVIKDQNGRIQKEDIVLIRKLHAALSPKFELILILNQVKRRNITRYLENNYMEILVGTIRLETRADIKVENVVMIAECDDDDYDDVSFERLKLILTTIPKQSLSNVEPITISKLELESMNENTQAYDSASSTTVGVDAFSVVTTNLAAFGGAVGGAVGGALYKVKEIIEYSFY